MKYKLVYLGTCNSDYFPESNLPVVQVEVDGTTTVGMLKERLLSYETFEPAISNLDLDTLNQLYIVFTAYKQAVEDFWQEHALVAKAVFDSKLGLNLDEREDYDVYAYFGIEEVDA